MKVRHLPRGEEFPWGRCRTFGWGRVSDPRKPGLAPGRCPVTIISLGLASRTVSNDLPEGLGAGHATLLFGLSPGGVCRAGVVSRTAVSSYLTISTLLIFISGIFLWPDPAGFPAPGNYPAPLPFRVRTFLENARRHFRNRPTDLGIDDTITFSLRQSQKIWGTHSAF